MRIFHKIRVKFRGIYKKFIVLTDVLIVRDIKFLKMNGFLVDSAE